MQASSKARVEGNKAAGPVGGVLGGAIGGVVGVVGGVVGVVTGGNNKGGQAPAADEQGEAPARRGLQQGEAPKQGEASKQGMRRSPRREPGREIRQGRQAATGRDLTRTGAPQLTAEQIVASSDANIERIKKELNLTPEQERHWAGFNSAMHYLGHNGADRLNLRIPRQRDPPDDIIEQMRNEAQFLNDRAVDQRSVADEPSRYSSLDDKQKAVFIQEMVNLSHERGLDQPAPHAE